LFFRRKICFLGRNFVLLKKIAKNWNKLWLNLSKFRFKK
jgi:hypothetical protein